MYIVLLTGGLASGKDTVSAMLADLGAAVFDLDQIAKEEQEKAPVLAKLKEAFGEDIVGSNGSLDRRLLATRAFNDTESSNKLNAICWPPVKQRVSDLVKKSHKLTEDKKGLLVIQIPLLAEAPDFLEYKDEVISVMAEESLRLKRALARGMSSADAQRRMKLQASDEERKRISDTIFENNGTIGELRDQVNSWYTTKYESGLF